MKAVLVVGVVGVPGGVWLGVDAVDVGNVKLGSPLTWF